MMNDLILKLVNYVLPNFYHNLCRLIAITLLLFFIIFVLSKSNIIHIFFKRILSNNFFKICIAIILLLGTIAGCVISIVEAFCLVFLPVLFLDSIFLNIIRFTIYHLILIYLLNRLFKIVYQTDLLTDSISSFFFVFITCFAILFAIWKHNDYKDIQIVKHALQFYIKRPDANEKDLEKEKKLLKKVENEVSNFKKSNNIK